MSEAFFLWSILSNARFLFYFGDSILALKLLAGPSFLYRQGSDGLRVAATVLPLPCTSAGSLKIIHYFTL